MNRKNEGQTKGSSMTGAVCIDYLLPKGEVTRTWIEVIGKVVSSWCVQNLIQTFYFGVIYENSSITFSW